MLLAARALGLGSTLTTRRRGSLGSDMAAVNSSSDAEG
jgi:hypothetical protein